MKQKELNAYVHAEQRMAAEIAVATATTVVVIARCKLILLNLSR
jgi:hypothetical protein